MAAELLGEPAEHDSPAIASHSSGNGHAKPHSETNGDDGDEAYNRLVDRLVQFNREKRKRRFIFWK